MQKEETTSGNKLRNFLLKVIVIIAIIALLIWLLPKFASYKKSSNKGNNKGSKITSKLETKYEKSHLELKNAGLNYYNEDKLPQEIGKKSKVTVEELQKENLISEIKDSNGTDCNTKDSYIEITKLENEYLLKTNLVFDDKEDYKIYHIGKYEHCENYLCENINQEEVEIESENKNQEQENITENNKQEETNKEDNNREEQKPDKNDTESKLVLTEFSKWSNYERTSCETKETTCAIDDQNCLQELKLFKRIEKIGDKKISYQVTYPTLLQTETKTKKLCDNYNYLEINGNLYYTNGEYGEVFNLNKNTTTNWTYNGQVSINLAPSTDINKYYKFVGIDETSCKDTCTENVRYYYDVYTYNHKLSLATNTSCVNAINKNYSVYKIENKTITKTETKPIYATACYKSVRIRSIEKNKGE